MKLQHRLVLIYFVLVFVEVCYLFRHAVSQLVLLDFDAALVNPAIAEGAQLDLRSRPVRQEVVRLIQQIVDAVEVALNRSLHLVALDYLLPSALQLVVGSLEDIPMAQS